MGIKVKTSRIYWHEADLMLPHKDGKYLVMTEHGTILDDTAYTKDGGWNTFRDDDGSINERFKMTNVALWSDPITVDEVEL